MKQETSGVCVRCENCIGGWVHRSKRRKEGTSGEKASGKSILELTNFESLRYIIKLLTSFRTDVCNVGIHKVKNKIRSYLLRGKM